MAKHLHMYLRRSRGNSATVTHLFHIMVNSRTLLTSLVSVAITVPAVLGANYHFVFGDGFSATGFDPSGALPNSANPIGNPAFPGATGITNWIGYLTATYNNSQVFTYDYANQGSTVDNDILQFTGLPDLKDKIDVFLNTVGSQPPSTPWTSSNSLFTFWVGNYDAPGTYGKPDPIGYVLDIRGFVIYLLEFKAFRTNCWMPTSRKRTDWCVRCLGTV